ncbi:MAG: hypothetical protein WC043_04360 [Pseudobdellovibrionaceae bacterium]
MKQFLNTFRLIIILATAGGILSACGIKPDNLEAPDPAYKPEFPQTYPSAD